jgi:hypothetical protein
MDMSATPDVVKARMLIERQIDQFRQSSSAWCSEITG